jgi:sugar O-acyltransferase (sialic acid O-acetyltransferase NeuD family)
LNANEPEARLVDVHVQDGQQVEKGALLFTIETTKAASEVEASDPGFVRMVAHQGDTLAVGDVLAFITATPDEPLEAVGSEKLAVISDEKAAMDVAPADLRITRPARVLAESLGLNLAALPTDRLVTEAIIRELAGSSAPTPASRLPISHPTNSQLLIYGAGGHAKTVLEMAQAVGAFRIAGIVDDNASLIGTSVLGIPVLGTRDLLPGLFARGIRLAANGVGGIINIDVRVKLFELLASYGFAFPILRHPRATVEPSAQIYDGVQVFANAYVGSSAILHEKCMINTGAIVSHDCEIGAYTHIAPGALLAGHVRVGERALVGMGVTTIIGLKIGDGARVGNGAILLADVPDRQIVPAGKVWAGEKG